MPFYNFFKRNSFIIAGVLALTGCTATTAKNIEQSPLNSEGNVTISASELAALKASSEQWQQSKAGVERLLLIEQDLKLLITQLSAAVKNEQKEQATNKSTLEKDQTSLVNNQSQANPSQVELQESQSSLVITDKKVTAEKATSEIQPLYALQVASVTEQARLTKSITSIKSTAPDLFTGKLITNVETAKVKGTTYYRLKLGAYQYQKNAQADCDKLKQQQVSCIVSHFTDNPIKL